MSLPFRKIAFLYGESFTPNLSLLWMWGRGQCVYVCDEARGNEFSGHRARIGTPCRHHGSRFFKRAGVGRYVTARAARATSSVGDEMVSAQFVGDGFRTA